MSYKKQKIDRPEWCEIGVRVRSKINKKLGTIWGAFFYENKPHVTLIWDGDNYTCGVDASMLEPLTVWQPKEGDPVACWDELDDGIVRFEKYLGRNSSDNYPHRTDQDVHRHIARIPDDFKITAETLTVGYWQEHGEQYEED